MNRPTLPNKPFKRPDVRYKVHFDTTANLKAMVNHPDCPQCIFRQARDELTKRGVEVK